MLPCRFRPGVPGDKMFPWPLLPGVPGKTTFPTPGVRGGLVGWPGNPGGGVEMLGEGCAAGAGATGTLAFWCDSGEAIRPRPPPNPGNPREPDWPRCATEAGGSSNTAPATEAVKIHRVSFIGSPVYRRLRPYPPRGYEAGCTFAVLSVT